MTLTASSTIAIAGGGLLGRLLAWQLLEQGFNVSVFDAGSFEQSPSAACTAAGMISPVSEAIDTEPLMFDLGMVSLNLWPLWLQQLQPHCSGTRVQYEQRGSLIVAHQRDQSLLQQYAQDSQRQLAHKAKVQKLSRDGIDALERDVAEHFQHALFFPEEAHIDNRALMSALYQRIQSLGGTCRGNTAVEVQPFCIELASSGKIEKYDVVIDCRGVGAKPQWQQVRGVRGEILRVQTDEVSLQRPVRLLHPRYQLYVVPKPNQEFVIGATQIESEDISPVSVQSALELNSALYTINPAFAEARIIEMESNLRPALNDNRPKIQSQNGLLKVNGLYRHGYLLAPVVVQQALALVVGVGQTDTEFKNILCETIDEESVCAQAIA